MERSPARVQDSRSRISQEAPAIPTTASPNTPAFQIPAGYINRPMLRQATGLTDKDLRRLAAQGLLKADKKNNRGWVLYKSEAIELVKQHMITLQIEEREHQRLLPPAEKDPPVAYSTDDGHAVFSRLKDGRSLIDIFMETKIHPAVINAILKDYERLSGSIIVAKSIVGQINGLALAGVDTIRSGNDMLIAFQNLNDQLYENKQCMACKRSDRSYCASCVEAVTKAAIEKATGADEDDSDTSTSEHTVTRQRTPRPRPSKGATSAPT